MKHVSIMNYFISDTKLGEGGISLSSGHQQLLTIARSMIQSSSLLLLDEPTASLQSNAEVHLHNKICSAFPFSTIITVTVSIFT